MCPACIISLHLAAGRVWWYELHLMGEGSRTQRDLPMVTQQVERGFSQPCLSQFCSQRLFPQIPEKGDLDTWVPIFKESVFDLGCGGKGSVFPVLIVG